MGWTRFSSIYYVLHCNIYWVYNYLSMNIIIFWWDQVSFMDDNSLGSCMNDVCMNIILQDKSGRIIFCLDNIWNRKNSSVGNLKKRISNMTNDYYCHFSQTFYSLPHFSSFEVFQIFSKVFELLEFDEIVRFCSCDQSCRCILLRQFYGKRNTFRGIFIITLDIYNVRSLEYLQMNPTFESYILTGILEIIWTKRHIVVSYLWGAVISRVTPISSYA